MTNNRPKPLLNVGGKPILEQIINGFSNQGFRHFWLCVHYKAELIEAHFGDGAKRGLKIKYIHEKTPLGTGGALRLLPKFDVPFIVCNADVLTQITYGKLMEFHARSNAQATVCLALHQHQVPYGVAEYKDEEFVGLREKPIEGTLVNAGVYVFDPEALEHMPGEGHFDVPDFLKNLDRLAAYPIDGHWIDVGHYQDYARANAEWVA